MRVRLRIDTVTDIANFVLAVADVKDPVLLKSDNGLVVNGKSFLGVAHASEFHHLWCECDSNIYSKIEHFVIIEDESEN
jgi:hypothetical protein